MSFRTTKIHENPATQFQRAVQVAAQLRREANAYRILAVGGSVRAQDLEEGLLATLVAARVALLQARDTRGIVQYAKEQVDDAAYDIAAEFTNMMSEIDATTTFFEANFPTGSRGHLETKRFVGDGTGRTESSIINQPNRLSGLILRLDALITAID